MLCPAVYPPDPTLGITDPQMLPSPKRVRRSRNYQHRPCPECGKSCPRDRVFNRTPVRTGRPGRGRPRDIRLFTPSIITQRRHYSSTATCPTWPRPRPATPIGSRFGPPGWSRRTWLTLSTRQLAPLARPSGPRPLRHHPELGGGQGKKRRSLESAQITSIGPPTASPGISLLMSCTTALWCVLSIVDNRVFKRLCYEVFGPRPGSPGYRGVLPAVPGGLDQLGLTLHGHHHRRPS